MKTKEFNPSPMTKYEEQIDDVIQVLQIEIETAISASTTVHILKTKNSFNAPPQRIL